MSETYSHEGPICPYCDRQFTADDPWYYDDSNTEMECDDCGHTFKMRIYTDTSWTCEPMEDVDA